MSEDTETLPSRGSTLFRIHEKKSPLIVHNGDTRFCLLETRSTKDSKAHFKTAIHEPLPAGGGSLCNECIGFYFSSSSFSRI